MSKNIWNCKHLISTETLSKEEVEILFSKAREYQKALNSPEDSFIKSPVAHKVIINLFLEPSTRTRVAFEIAAKKLQAKTLSIQGDSSSFMKGESLKDTALSLQALKADMIIMRHAASGASKFLSTLVDIPIINAGDGSHEHPTQALLDCFTLVEHFGTDLSKIKITIIGDILHSRVARSNIFLMKTLGAQVTLAGPAALAPKLFESFGVTVCHDFREATQDADAVMMLRIQKERQGVHAISSIEEYRNSYGLTRTSAQWLKPNTIIMHPGPINRDVEIDSKIADSKNSVILNQIANGVPIRMAAIDLCMKAGEK